MKLRVYMNDWSMNMGIVGFLNIFNHAYKNNIISENPIKMEDNYIEFDSSSLEDFHNYYFNYFLDKDNMYKSIQKNINMKFNYIKSNPDKISTTLDALKKDIKYQNDKVKKYFHSDYEIISSNLDKLKGIKKEEDIEGLRNILDSCLEIFEKEYVNRKLTINKTRSYIGGNFFGQVSFLQKSRAGLDIHEQSQFMYRDYILPILDYCKLNDLLENKNIEQLSKFIDQRFEENNMSKAIEGIFKEIKKIFKKNNNIITVIDYYKSDKLKMCEMCTDHRGITSNYTEGNFSPLAVSADNAMNMYWNMNLDFSICDICKLMLFCTPAGSTLIRKKYIENKDKDNEFYSFVNMDTSIKDLYNKNLNLRSKRDKENPFEELIIDIVGENEEKSRWQLENILFVEFKASVDAKKCVMNYFNMPTYIAEFFSCKENKVLNSISDKNLKASVIDIILKEKDLKFLINKKLREKITGIIDVTKATYILSRNVDKIISTRYILNCYKNGGKENVDDKKLKAIRYSGRDIHDYYVQSNSKNKIDGIAYRLLNTAKVRNKKDFMDIVLRLFMSCEKSVPTVFLDVMAEKELDFESIAYAFISGLISEKYEQNTQGGK